MFNFSKNMKESINKLNIIKIHDDDIEKLTNNEVKLIYPDSYVIEKKKVNIFDKITPNIKVNDKRNEEVIDVLEPIPYNPPKNERNIQPIKTVNIRK